MLLHERDVARLSDNGTARAIGRGGPKTADWAGGSSRTITLDCGQVVIVLTVRSGDHDRVLLAGRLMPGGRCRVRLSTGALHQEAIVDGQGGFTFDSVPHGLVRLELLPAVDGGEPGHRVPTVRPSVIV